jgi:hypothetical protein
MGCASLRSCQWASMHFFGVDSNHDYQPGPIGRDYSCLRKHILFRPRAVGLRESIVLDFRISLFGP